MSTTPEQPKGSIRAMRLLIDKGARRYDAERHLERLLVAESALSGKPNIDRAAVIARIKRALRSQRQLGRAGHWSYDLNRHFGLLQALKAEQARTRAEPTNQSRPQPAAAVNSVAVRADPAMDDTGTEAS